MDISLLVYMFIDFKFKCDVCGSAFRYSKKCTNLSNSLEEAGGKQCSLGKLFAALYMSLNPHFKSWELQMKYC